jgi:glycosyltransferase involved in cell wall biosynthesis
VTLLPYRRIYQSAVVHLAYSYRRPVIASDLPGLTGDVHEGVDGWLVPPDDPERWAAALRRLVERRGICAEVAHHIGKRSRASWSEVARDTVAAYERFATRQRAPSDRNAR